MKAVGLVLGSGGARGWAHIGVIRALEAANIEINYIAGASIGALVGAIYAAGEMDDLEEFIRALDWRDIVSFFDVVFPSSGLLDGNRVYELLSRHLQEMNIEDAAIDFCCVATDLGKGEEVCLRTGSIADAVRASISIPGIFTPFQRDEQCLGDGGIINPMPVDLMQDMGADVVIAVNLSRKHRTDSRPIMSAETLQSIDRDDRENEETPPTSRIQSILGHMRQQYETVQDKLQEKMEHWLPERKQGLNIFDVIGTSIGVMEQQVTRSKLDACPPDILVEPMLDDYGIFDFHQADSIIEEGYRCMSALIPELQQKL